jgi:hypothetical protein
MGRAPMMQPPGSETVARRKPAQQRAHDADGAAHFADEIVIAHVLDFARLDPQRAALEGDVSAKGGENFAHEPTSLKSGTRRMTHGSEVSSVAAMMGSTAFFAPLMVTSPCNGHAALDEQTIHEQSGSIPAISVRLILPARGQESWLTVIVGLHFLYNPHFRSKRRESRPAGRRRIQP